MATINGDLLQKLAEGFARPERLHDGALLAGGGLLDSMARLRARQAKREAVRTIARDGEASGQAARRKAEATMLTERSVAISAEVATRAMVQPVLGDKEAGLFGLVTEAGRPLAGARVSVIDDRGATLRHSCTGRDGSYSIAFAGDGDVRLTVASEGRLLYGEREAFAYPPGRRIRRDIDLSRVDLPCDDDRPPVEADIVQVPQLIGMKTEQAMKMLDAVGLSLGKRSKAPGKEPGVIVRQHPDAGASVKKGSRVDLVIGTGDDRTEPLTHRRKS